MERFVEGWDEHRSEAFGYSDVEDAPVDFPNAASILPESCSARDDAGISAQALRESEERYRYTIALSPLIAWTADPIGGILDVDERGLAQVGLSLDQARGQGFFTAVHPGDRQKIAAMWRRNATLGHPIDNDVRMRMNDGSYRWHRSRAAPRRDAAGKILRWYGTIEDVHERKLAGDAIRWAAEHDGLTGVWGRAAFFAALEQALLQASKAYSKVALLLLDLDGFKQINDQFGHQMGDTLLKEVASRLSGSADRSTMVGRLGGDEFALFLARPSSPELLGAIDEAIAALEVPFHHDGNAHRCRSSVGVALYPADGADSETLRENADLALYDAKAHGGGVIRYFRGELRLRMQQRLSMLSIARDALDRDLILPYYQPKVDLRTDRIIGFEALLRWKHVGRGVQSPASIAAAFDDPTLAVALGDRMHAKVLADIRDWLNAGVAFGRIAINAAAAEFNRPDFAARFLARLAAADVPPTCMELEITESVILSNRGDHVSRLITQLRAAGVTIALDDFGTGYASLAHLKEYPVDVLKIDRSFVSTLSNCDGAIVRAIVGLGQALDIRTVAEGVETTAQSDTLLRLGCDLGQGYLFSTPIEAGAVAGLIAAHPGHVARERRVGAERRGKRLKSA